MRASRKRIAGQRWWLVGASEGLGRALAVAMAREGAEVIVSARSAERLASLCAQTPGLRALPADVTDAESVARAAREAGTVDGVVYLAGAYWPMRAQEWDSDRIAAMLAVNLAGAVRVVGAVLPGMLARGSGQIVLTGSLSGYRGLPGAIGYGASKAGVMALAESMQADLQGSGVTVQQVNPGFIRTRLTARNDFAMPFILEPEEAAEHMLKAITLRRPHTAFPWLFSLLFRLGRFLPQTLWLWIFRTRT